MRAVSEVVKEIKLYVPNVEKHGEIKVPLAIKVQVDIVGVQYGWQNNSSV